MTEDVTGDKRSGPRYIWFVDTATLLSMAVDDDIRSAVLDEIGNDVVIVIGLVRDELEYRKTKPETASLARKTLADLPSHWRELDSTAHVTWDEVADVQDEVRDGKPLKHPDEHLAESSIIAMGKQSAASTTGHTSIKVLFSEDFNDPTGRALGRAAYPGRRPRRP